MNLNLNNLIAAIVSEIKERGSYATKTKILKLLYLFDVEYYRTHREIFTGLDWKYYKLGPWTGEYDLILDNLVSQGELLRTPGLYAEHNTEFYSTPNVVPIKNALSVFSDENILRSLLNTWADKTTGEILDYVYFQTEPILRGTRNELLDFSLIPKQSLGFYKRSSSGSTSKEIKEFRKRLEQRKARRVANKPKALIFTPPRYDDEYLQAIEALEE